MNQFITRAPTPGEVITTYHNDNEDSPDAELFRVLAVNSKLDRIVFIRATPKQSAGRLYFLNLVLKSCRGYFRQISANNFCFSLEVSRYGLTFVPHRLSWTRNTGVSDKNNRPHVKNDPNVTN